MKCRSCNNLNLISILDLGNHAWCNDFRTPDKMGTEPTYPLEMVYCEQCGLAQLNHTVPKETMFTEHDYVSGTTKTLREHFKHMAETMDKFNYPKDGLIVDIGGNDGTQLQEYQKLGYTNVCNVESATNIAEIATKNGVYTRNTFFNLAEALKIKAELGQAKIINAAGVFFHLEELHSVCNGIKLLLAKDGRFVVQCMYLGSMIRKTTFDGIYHEHLCYYSLRSLQNLLNKHKLYIQNWYLDEIHGGSLMVSCGHDENHVDTSQLEMEQLCTLEGLQKFAGDVKQIKQRLLTLLNENKPVYGIGAPAKGNTLLTYLGVTTEQIPFLLEMNPMKCGKVSPVTHIPVVEETEERKQFGKFFVLSWNFAKEIMSKYPKDALFILPFEKEDVV